MFYQIKIAETGRNFPSSESHIFNVFTEKFKSKEQILSFLSERYGSIPGARRKVFRDRGDEAVETGFTHSFWNQDISHNSDNWFQTDWVEISKVTEEPVLLKQLKEGL